MANLKEAFVIMPTDTNENEFMITIGNHLATEKSRIPIVLISLNLFENAE